MRDWRFFRWRATAVLSKLSVLYASGVSMSYAQGGPPMLTDDPCTPGAGQWEINTAFLEDRTATARMRSFPHIDINYGLGDHIQLKYETGYLFTDGRGTAGVRRDWGAWVSVLERTAIR